MDSKKICLLIALMICFTAFASAEVTYQSPNDGQDILYGNEVSHEFEVQGSGGVIELYIDGSFVESWSQPSGGCSCLYDYPITYDSSDSGTDHNWDVVYYDSTDGSDDDPGAQSYHIMSDAEATVLSSNGPGDGASVSDHSVTFDYTVEESSDNSGTVELIADTCSQNADTLETHTPNTQTSNRYTDDYTYSDCSGDFTWYPFYTGADGSTKTGDVRTLNIESDASQITGLSNLAPSDGDEFDSDSNQEYDMYFEVQKEGGDQGDVDLYVDGQNMHTWSPTCSSCTETFDTTITLDDGSYDWYAEFDGDDGSSTSSSTWDFDILNYADRSTVSVTSPNDGETIEEDSVTFGYGATGESGTIELYMDGNMVDSYSHPSSTSSTETHTESGVSNGDHDFYAKYVGDDDSTKTTDTKTFTVDATSDAENTTVDLVNPNDGETFDSDTSEVGFDVQHSGNSGTIDLYLNGSVINTWSVDQNYGGSTLYIHNEAVDSGYYEFYAEYTGDDGSTKTTGTRSFSVKAADAEATDLTAHFPENDMSYSTKEVEYNGTVSGRKGGVELYRNGSLRDNYDYNGSGSQDFSYTETLEEGVYEYYLRYVGNDGSTKETSVREFTVDLADSGIALDTPEDGAEITGEFPFDVSYSFTVVGENGSVELYRDGSVIETFTHDEEVKTYSHSETFYSRGSHSYHVEYTRDIDGQNVVSDNRSFEVLEDESVSLDIGSPASGSVFEHDESTDFSYSVTTNVAGNADLLLNGSSVDSHSLAQDSTQSYSYSDNLAGGYYTSRVKFVSDRGNTHYSDYVNFSVKNSPVDYIENIEYRYRDVGGSLDQSVYLDLSGNSTITGHEPVSGDTASFSSDEWLVENVSVPYSETFVVNDDQGGNTTQEIEIGISVKNISGHPENANLSYQEKNKTLIVDNNASAFDLNYSCANEGYGDPVKVDGLEQVTAGATEAVGCTWSGDWLSYSSGDAGPTVDSVEISEMLPVSRWVSINNSQDLEFPSVRPSEASPDPTCISNNTVSVSSGSVNESASYSCDIGDEGSPQLTVDSENGYTRYDWNTTLNVSSDLAENISISWRFEKSKLQDWSSKDAGSSVAYVKGVSDDILLVESSSSVEVIVPDDAFQSSLHEGLHPASLRYTKGDTGGSGGGGGSGGSSSPPTIIRNVTGEYNWSVSAPRSQGQTFFNIIGWSGRDLGQAPTRIVAENQGDNNFTLSVKCVSNDESCEFIELSDKNITLNALESRSQTVNVEGVLPQEIPDDGYRFNIVFEDPEGKEIETNFRINKNFGQSLIIRFVNKVFGVRDVDFDGEGGGDPVPIPLFLPVFLSSLLVWGLMAAAIRFAQSNRMIEKGMDFTRGRLIVVLVYFILAFVFI